MIWLEWNVSSASSQDPVSFSRERVQVSWAGSHASHHSRFCPLAAPRVRELETQPRPHKCLDSNGSCCLTFGLEFGLGRLTIWPERPVLISRTDNFVSLSQRKYLNQGRVNIRCGFRNNAHVTGRCSCQQRFWAKGTYL